MPAHVDEFLATSIAAYDECDAGINTLDKIIVSCSAHLSGATRAALVPALYAYWERFFRVCFGEFLRCAGLSGHPLRELNPRIHRLRLRREIYDRTISVDKLAALVDSKPLSEAREAIRDARDVLHEIESLCDAPADFPEPEKWVITESNVRFSVLEKNCSRLGISMSKMKAAIEKNGMQLHPDLEDLVNTRNDIAHGQVIGTLEQSKWEKLRLFTLALMNATHMLLWEALEDDAYLRAAS